eukprot:TRINITY_DN1926_c0_g1_i1.p1 TRINITY_DN1926_c0_g1~~TRINITY_DN1926_c0_g1_i1.p1  ORF type:complete len:194 (-),score=68.18 TRINITY_DN1926_c0_g1_i1:56-637(-)
MRLVFACLALLATLAAAQTITIGGIPIKVNLTEIIQIGQAVWQVVENNQAVSNVTDNSASAVPAGITDWTLISGWQSTSSAQVEYKVHDPIFIPMVDYTYKVVFNYGGKLTANGVTGMYVADVRVQPDEVWVAFGNTFESSVTVSSQVLNVGTQEAPIAALTVVHRLHFHNWSRDEVREDTFVVRADGVVQQL